MALKRVYVTEDFCWNRAKSCAKLTTQYCTSVSTGHRQVMLSEARRSEECRPTQARLQYCPEPVEGYRSLAIRNLKPGLVPALELRAHVKRVPLLACPAVLDYNRRPASARDNPDIACSVAAWAHWSPATFAAPLQPCSQ